MRASEQSSRVLGKEQIRAFEELKKVNVAGAQRMKGGGGWVGPGWVGGRGGPGGDPPRPPQRRSQSLL